MGKGRKAEAGTYEAREYVTKGNFDILLENESLSKEAKIRIIKAVKFGLGIKTKQKTIEKINNVISNVLTNCELTETDKKEAEQYYAQDGDIYFPPEERKAVDY